MPTSLEQLTSRTIALSPEDRARLPDRLLALLPDDADEPLDEAWDQGIQRRVNTVEAGTARLIAATVIRAEARKSHQR